MRLMETECVGDVDGVDNGGETDVGGDGDDDAVDVDLERMV